MKALKWLGCVAALISAVAIAYPQQQPKYWSETQPATRSVPSSSCVSGLFEDAGIYIRGSQSVLETWQCADGSAFTAGTAIHFWCDPLGTGLWQLANSNTQYSIPVVAQQFPDAGYLPSTGPAGSVVYQYGYWLPATSSAACNGGSWDGGVIMTVGTGSMQ